MNIGDSITQACTHMLAMHKQTAYDYYAQKLLSAFPGIATGWCTQKASSFITVYSPCMSVYVCSLHVCAHMLMATCVLLVAVTIHGFALLKNTTVTQF